MTFWRRLPCKISEVRLDITLACGQSFRWREISPGLWRSVLFGRVWTLKQTSDEILYQVHVPPSKDGKEEKSVKNASKAEIKKENVKSRTSKKTSCEKSLKTEIKEENELTPHLKAGGVKIKIKEEYRDEDEMTSFYSSILVDYFQLNVELEHLYNHWSSNDKHFRQVASDFPGVRILRQDPVENLFSFICSSNNHISRISGMVEKLCTNYGEKLMELDGVVYHGFPDVEALAADGVEERLRELGFGYRAKFISKSAKYILEEKPSGWLYSLRDMKYEDAKQELIQLCGVGAKVADCVCLMSLDKSGAIPVDTHVWQIAARDYMPKLTKNKSLTETIYKEIGDFFRELWGDYAGWAHSVLFSADLRKFQDLKKTPPEIKEDVKAKKRATPKEKLKQRKKARR